MAASPPKPPEHARMPEQAGRSESPGEGSKGGSGPSNSIIRAVSAPTLSLPKGGGAVHGMGEKFNMNACTGTASLSVPVPTSPGRGGVGPSLELVYDSGAGNGPFGLGWHLGGLATITRKTDKGLPTYRDAEESDVYLLSGAEDLVPEAGPGVVRDGHRVRRYRPRTEGLFARIERWTRLDSGDIHWRVTTRDNLSSVFGRDPAARIADPEHPEHVFSWLVEESADDRGNLIQYRYRAEDAANVDTAAPCEVNRFARAPDGSRRLLTIAQRYIDRIHYGNRRPNDSTEWLFEVVFDYGDWDDDPASQAPTRSWPARPDPFSTYRAGFEVRTWRVCHRVRMFHRFAELGPGPTLVRSLDLTYRPDPAATRLSSITQTGYRRDAGGSWHRASLPPLELDYAPYALGREIRALDATALEGIPGGVDGGAAQWVDLDGEGIPGALMSTPGGWLYKANQGAGRFAAPRLVGGLPSPRELAGGQYQLLDVDGDGRLEVVRHTPPMSGYAARQDDDRWTAFRPFHSVPNIAWGDPNLRFVDLDGDGHADVLITEHDVLRWYRSKAKEGFEPGGVVRKPRDEERGPALVFADGVQSVHLADMSGDGLADLVRVRDGELCYWPNLGYGRFGAKVPLESAPRFGARDPFDPRRVRLVDVDGSGPADLLYLGHDGVRIYRNLAGNRLGPAELIALPTGDTLSSTSAVDLLGNGTMCLVWSSPAPASARQPVRYVDLHGGLKPHLMVAYRNNLGAETRVEYASSTRFYLADKAAGRPWVTRLPFPVQVVERVVTLDHIAHNRFVARRAYHHGYFDGVEREFRGFGMVEEWDTEDIGVLRDAEAPTSNEDANSHVPPVLTRTWFHTGAFREGSRISRQFEEEYYRPPGGDALDVWRLPDSRIGPDRDLEDQRDALRALRGSLLRQEVYSLDGSPKAAHPYLVTEKSYEVRRLQERGVAPHAVFHSHEREALEIHLERNPADPRVTHSLTLEVDDYGNVRRSLAVCYGRQLADPELIAADQAVQAALHATCTEQDVTNAVDTATAWRTPLPWRAQTWEVTGVSVASGARLSFEAADAASRSLNTLDYEQSPTPGVIQRRLIGAERVRFRKDDMSAPLPFGAVEPRALPFESYQLVFSPGLVAALFGSRVTETMLREGGHVTIEGAPGWWAPSGRVFFHETAGVSASTELAAATAHFFQPARFTDPFGEATRVRHDGYDLLPLEVRDPLGNTVTVGVRAADGTLVEGGHDYRVLQPRVVMDPNRNRSEAAFDALGLVVATAIRGKPEESFGDVLAGFEADPSEADRLAHFAAPGADPGAMLGRASTRLLYDLDAWRRTRDGADPQPPVVCTLVRETHDSELGPGERTKIQQSFSYSDGFGREIQKKLAAEPGPLVEGGPTVSPRWVGSGWTVFDNKGHPVRKYEPFFTATHGFELARKVGVSAVSFYDPIGRAVGVLHPNHTWEKVVFDAWKQESWDVGDTIGVPDPRSDADVGAHFGRLPTGEYLPSWSAARSAGALGADEQEAATKAVMYAGTPSRAHVDGLGRSFLTVAHNRFERGGVTVEERPATRLVLDIEGNQREVVDALGRVVMRYGYDVVGKRCTQASMEAGERLVLDDVAGKPLYTWDSRGHVIRIGYDALRRPVRSYVSGGTVGKEILFEKSEFGEGYGASEAERVKLNLRGRLARQYDAAGTVSFVGTNPETGKDEAYDFKGNPLRVTRQLGVAYKRALDWATAEALEPGGYTTSTRYDALNRPTETVTPDGSRTRPTFNEANLLDQVEVSVRGAASVPMVSNMDYNARGQRARIVYGNGVETVLGYDPLTWHLTRLTTTRSAAPKLLQDLSYTYDPAGNITRIRDAAQDVVYFRNRLVEPENGYTYDATYRLIAATGREHLGQVGGVARSPTAPGPGSAPGGRLGAADGAAMGRYLQSYDYDMVGNIREMAHRGTDPSQPGWTRKYGYGEKSLLEPGKVSNRLSTTEVGSAGTERYEYDAHGNMVKMPHLPKMGWDHRDRLVSSSKQVIGSGTPETTWYVYDAAGERVRKVTEGVGGAGKLRERVYVGGWEVARAGAVERETLHLMDDKQRVALVETRTKGTDAGLAQIVRYQLGNHLASAVLEVDGGGEVVSYEEYHPYGSTAYQAVRSDLETPKRYRYTGNERDEETGLQYHSARYYAPWVGRWVSCDPAGLEGGANLFGYAAGNPTNRNDPSGEQPPEAAPDGGRAPREVAQAQAQAPVFDQKPTLREFIAVNQGQHPAMSVADLTAEWRRAHPRGVKVYSELVAASGNVMRHAFMVVTTDDRQVVLELQGNHGGLNSKNESTGDPRVDDFWGFAGRSGVRDETPGLTAPTTSPGASRFEDRLVQFAEFFQEKSGGKYSNLPEYHWYGPNSNGFVRALVELAGGSITLPSRFPGQNNISEYESALESRFGPLENASERARSSAPASTPSIVDQVNGALGRAADRLRRANEAANNAQRALDRLRRILDGVPVIN